MEDDMPDVKRSILELRAQLKFKSVLDFLLKRNANFVGTSIDSLLADCPECVRLSQGNENDSLLEKFQLGDYFAVRRVGPNHEGKEYYVILDSVSSDIGAVYLLCKDSTNSSVLDSLYLRGRGFSYRFGRLNGYDMIVTTRLSWGTGYVLEEESYSIVSGRKLELVFSTRLVEITSSQESQIVTLREVSFAELNGDSSLDIMLKETIKRIPSAESEKVMADLIERRDKARLYGITSEEAIQESSSEYYWTKETRSFEKLSE